MDWLPLTYLTFELLTPHQEHSGTLTSHCCLSLGLSSGVTALSQLWAPVCGTNCPKHQIHPSTELFRTQLMTHLFSLAFQCTSVSAKWAFQWLFR